MQPIEGDNVEAAEHAQHHGGRQPISGESGQRAVPHASVHCVCSCISLYLIHKFDFVTFLLCLLPLRVFLEMDLVGYGELWSFVDIDGH